jgi:uncharacterized protein (DUF58 family)
MTSSALHWTSSPVRRRLVALSLLTLATAAVTGRGDLVAVAAPLLLLLAAFDGGRRPETLAAVVSASSQRCSEGDTLELQLRVGPDAAEAGDAPSPPPAAPPVRASLAGSPSWQVLGEERTGDTWTWRVTARTWGRHGPGTLELLAETPGALWCARLRLPAPEVSVEPDLPSPKATAHTTVLRARAGGRTAARAGSGSEFLGVRPYAPGDVLNRVNWPATARHDRLHVTTLAAEQAQDVLLLVDGMVEIGAFADTTVDRAVRAAAALARAHLRVGDRVGLVTVTPAMRWTLPGLGTRLRGRLMEHLLDIRRDYTELPPDLGRIPPFALPAGALVVALTPLLDERSLALVADLRMRGLAVLVVDVLGDVTLDRSGARTERVAQRLWALERAATAAQLGARGIPVLPWAPDGSLDVTMAPAVRRPVAGTAGVP